MTQLEQTFSGIAEAIRSQTGENNLITPANMPTEISKLSYVSTNAPMYVATVETISENTNMSGRFVGAYYNDGTTNITYNSFKNNYPKITIGNSVTNLSKFTNNAWYFNLPVKFQSPMTNLPQNNMSMVFVNSNNFNQPISVPEGPAAPDPEEVELNSPFKAAGPVPGSIGSAVSGPEVAPGQTPSVAFNDPATSENGMTNTSAPAAKPKAKMSKTTLMLLCVIGGMVVIALAAVLIMQLTGNPIF